MHFEFLTKGAIDFLKDFGLNFFLILIAVADSQKTANEVVFGFIDRAFHRSATFEGEIAFILQYFDGPDFHCMVLWAWDKDWLLFIKKVRLPPNHTYMFFVCLFLRPQKLQLVMCPFPDLNAAIRGTRQQIRRFSNSLMQIGKVGLDPAIFLKPIKVKVPSNTVDNLIVGLNYFNNLKFAVVDSYGAIWKSHREEALDLAGVEG